MQWEIWGNEPPSPEMGTNGNYAVEEPWSRKVHENTRKTIIGGEHFIISARD